MVKRLLTIACLAIATCGLQAQTLQVNPASKLHNTSVRRAPARAASLDGTTAFGYGTTTGWEGLGVNATGVVFDVAIYVPTSSAFKDATINGINIPVLDTGMKNVSAWIRSDINGSNLATAKAAGPYKENDYFTVAFDEPLPVPEQGFYAGYTFTCSIPYPIAMGTTFADYGMLLQFDGSGWSDYSDQFPASPLQVLLSGISLPDYSLDLNYVGESIQVPNSAYEFYVEAMSSSAKEIKNIDLEVTIDGKSEMQHIVLPAVVESGINQPTTFLLTGTSPASVGRFDADIVVKKINGEEYTGESKATGVLKNVSRMAQRRTVVEEFTGTGCGYCPRGWAGMEYMKEKYPDTFIGIAFHKYNNTDPMYYANYPGLGLSGAPGCVIDRKVEADPYYGLNEDVYGIETAFQQYNSIPVEVDAKVSAQWNEEETAAVINANVEFLVATNPVSLVYVLTADSLTGAASSWKQSNYYSSYSSSEPGISDFCTGGKYGKSSVTLVFNDVVIGSSYNTQLVNKGASIGSDQIETGAVCSASYTILMPTKASLKAAVKKHLVYANVLVVDATTGEILNAARTKVTSAGGEDAIDIVRDSQPATTLRYNVAGQAIATPQRGLNIVRTSDGRVRKLMVK